LGTLGTGQTDADGRSVDRQEILFCKIFRVHNVLMIKQVTPDE
jgi:hypothetical protein